MTSQSISHKCKVENHETFEFKINPINSSKHLLKKSKHYYFFNFEILFLNVVVVFFLNFELLKNET